MMRKTIFCLAFFVGLALAQKPDLATDTQGDLPASRVDGLSSQNVSIYNWSRNPGGAVVIGANTVTLTPGPLGVSGSNTDLDIRITDATSGNENALVTGGTCDGTALPSCTIQFTATIAHTAGQWTIGSATGGLEECFSSISIGGACFVTSTVLTHAETNIKTNHVALLCNTPGGGGSISPRTNNINVFTINVPSGFSNFVVDGCDLDGTFATGVTAFNAVSQNNIRLRNLTINRMQGVNWDRVVDSEMIDITFGKDVYFVVGSTVDGAGDFAQNIKVDGLRQRATGLTWTDTNDFFTCSRCIQTNISNVILRSMNGLNDGIVIANQSEGIKLSNISIVQVNTCVRLKNTTVGATTTAPAWTQLLGLECDGSDENGVVLETGTRFTTLAHVYDTNAQAGYISSIHLQAGSIETQILSPELQSPVTGQSQILVDAGVSKWSLIGGRIETIAGGTGINILAGASDNFIIAGVSFTGSGTLLADGSTGDNKQIFGNNPLTLGHTMSGDLEVDSVTNNKNAIVTVASTDGGAAFAALGTSGGNFHITAGDTSTSSRNMVFNVSNAGVETEGMRLVGATQNFGVGTSVVDELFHVSKNVDGLAVLSLFENKSPNVAASLNETAEIRFAFGGDNDVGRIVVGKEDDYDPGPGENDSFMALFTDLNGIATEVLRLTSAGVVTVQQELQWNEAAGDPACVAGEYWIAANDSTNIFRKCQDGALSNLDTSGAVRWDEITDPSAAATSLTSDATSETVTFSFESAFGASQQFLIRQQTGNPTAGTLLDVRAADTNVTVFRAGDGTNGITVSQAGALTAEGTGAITATALAADALDAMTEIATSIKRRADDVDTHLVTTAAAIPGASRCAEIDTNGSLVLAADTCANLGPAGSNSFGTIGVAVADSGADTLTVTDSPTINFTTTDNPEDLTADLLPAGVGSVTWLPNADGTWTWDIAAAGVNPTAAFAASSIELDANLTVDDEQEFRLKEEDSGGENYLGFKAPAAVTANGICTLLDSTTDIVPDTCVGGILADELIALASEVSGTLPVGSGGSGVTAPTDGGILIGAGTSPFVSLGVATNGQIPIGDGTTAPVLAVITAEAGGEISVTNGAGSIELDVVEANLDLAALGGTLDVPSGGSGAGTFTDGGLLLGSGTGPFTALGVATNGQIPIGDGATDPVLATITGGTEITVVNGSGSITINGDFTPSSTDTLTEKTIDCEASGNVCTIKKYILYKAAGCQNTTAATGFDLSAANTPTATCKTFDTDVKYATMDFSDAGTNEEFHDHFQLPTNYVSGNMDLDLVWFTTATSGNARWAVRIQCVDDAEVPGATWEDETVVTDAAQGITLQFNEAQIANIDDTACSGDDTVFVEFYRDSSDAGDTITSVDLSLMSARLVVRDAQ